ncbi:MAG: hypothetical protein EB037_10450 [Actinobacteria bacterium]|jgi:hypothetical protein|nr:hypothetical protein [Actinomycetota bacterium]
MPMTRAQRDNWFTYHFPTTETEPKHKAILEKERSVRLSIAQAFHDGLVGAALYQLISNGCEAFAVLIDGLAPDSADKSAAIRCVRLAYDAYNEAATPVDGAANKNQTWLIGIAEAELVKARWQANSAIACGGV